jgi:hypothetical protein
MHAIPMIQIPSLQSKRQGMMQACAYGGLWRSAHPRKKKYTSARSNGHDFEYIQIWGASIGFTMCESLLKFTTRLDPMLQIVHLMQMYLATATSTTALVV